MSADCTDVFLPLGQKYIRAICPTSENLRFKPHNTSRRQETPRGRHQQKGIFRRKIPLHPIHPSHPSHPSTDDDTAKSPSSCSRPILTPDK